MEEELFLKYDGPALREHRMDVRDLAPALMGLADAVTEAGKAIDPNSRVRLDVKAHNEGSFEIQMVIDAVSGAGMLLMGAEATMLANGITITGAIAKSIRGAMKIASRVVSGGGRPEVISEDPHTSLLKLGFPDGSTLEAHGMDWVVFSNGKAMAGIEKTVTPLREGIIDVLELDLDGEKIAVTPDQRPGFSKDYRNEVLSDETTKLIFQIEGIKFNGNKWSVTDGSAHFTVEIEDQGFLQRVENRQVFFGNGDSMIADVRTVQRIDNGTIKTDRSVVRVIKIVHLASE